MEVFGAMAARSKAFRAVTLGLALLVGAAIGVVAGAMVMSRRSFGQARESMAGELGMSVRMATYLRLGEQEMVAEQLEREIDSAIIVVADLPAGELGDSEMRMLRSAKTYRLLYPSTSSLREQVEAGLAEVEPLDSMSADSPLGRLSRQAGER